MTLRTNLYRCLLAIVLQGIAASGYAQILNPGFDAWAGGEPVSWHTNNASPAFVTVTQSADAHSNSTAARGEAVTFSTFVIAPFIISGPESRGFPVNSQQPALHGWYKFLPAGDDQFYVSVNMLAGGNLVGAGAYTSPDSQSTFGEFIADITYFSTDVPDTCIILATVLNFTGNVNAGSVFLVDDLAFGAVTAVGEEGKLRPGQFGLSQNYPNPFNPSTVISYHVAQDNILRDKVSLKVYDMLGQLVATLVDEPKAPGEYSAQWDAANVPSGMYFYRLSAGNFSDVKKMILLK